MFEIKHVIAALNGTQNGSSQFVEYVNNREQQRLIRTENILEFWMLDDNLICNVGRGYLLRTLSSSLLSTHSTHQIPRCLVGQKQGNEHQDNLSDLLMSPVFTV